MLIVKGSTVMTRNTLKMATFMLATAIQPTQDQPNSTSDNVRQWSDSPTVPWSQVGLPLCVRQASTYPRYPRCILDVPSTLDGPSTNPRPTLDVSSTHPRRILDATLDVPSTLDPRRSMQTHIVTARLSLDVTLDVPSTNPRRTLDAPSTHRSTP